MKQISLVVVLLAVLAVVFAEEHSLRGDPDEEHSLPLRGRKIQRPAPRGEKPNLPPHNRKANTGTKRSGPQNDLRKVERPNKFKGRKRHEGEEGNEFPEKHMRSPDGPKRNPNLPAHIGGTGGKRHEGSQQFHPGQVDTEDYNRQKIKQKFGDHPTQEQMQRAFPGRSFERPGESADNDGE
mmetsp:Transcript_16138/g.21346  ORF Transcript_16138/g.21346 Transcript_16138/m.21346 type:complete len:181 (-) Transcript_16138:506-1048(-)|eukprot:CAMPEP_0117757138 /NCGR_PEP_ID=MMETSP0947-20121206/14533_1 /TAXON_ID=44440 /ORGANISM="Chattonella subsalsa, Strain CCMP2191" /LENGTH=180 /DNA_ID=CAMNT_0005576935 /DNA_START=45 /DNA_END=587 /DNA_ORIENTATION=+